MMVLMVASKSMMMLSSLHSNLVVAVFTVILVATIIPPVICFAPQNYYHGDAASRRCKTTTRLWMASNPLLRRNVHIPLLDLLLLGDDVSEYKDKIVTPLPSAHLPQELTTLNLYGMELDRPVHKKLMENAISRGGEVVGEVMGGPVERAYGHIVYKPSKDGSLVGAIGCAAEIVINAPTAKQPPVVVVREGEEPYTVVCRGSYRFRVKKVIQTFPYPVGIVDELLDEDPSTASTSIINDEEEEDDEDVDDLYASLTPSELVQRTMQAMKAIVDQQLKGKTELTPLEKSILEESGVPGLSASDRQSQAEEMAAVLDVFQSSLIDIAPLPVDRYYAIGMMAAELANLSNDVRAQILATRNGIERLRIVLREMDGKVGMARARKVADEITGQSDESSKDLKVGTPQLPPWASQLREGTRIEYYWNEQYEWCAGTVSEEPVKVVDELIVTVRFDDNDETHRLPFRGDEKARWRPATS